MTSFFLRSKIKVTSEVSRRKEAGSLVDSNRLKGMIVESGRSPSAFARAIDENVDSFLRYLRLQKFPSGVMYKIRKELSLSDADCISIFFKDE